jgi:hypothetical protein
MLLTVATLLAAFAAPPQCTPATVTTAAGVPVDLAINCTGAGPNPTVTITTPPFGGTLPALPGTYSPNPGFNGIDFLRYTVTSDGETSEPTTINIVVDAPPTCENGLAETLADTPLALKFPCTDPDGGNVLVKAEDGNHGTVDPKVGTTFTYTPEPGFVGTDEVRFAALVGGIAGVPRTLVITVGAKPVTAEPTATPAATAAPPPAAAPVPDRTAPALSVKAGRASVAKGATFTLTADEAGTARLTLTAGKYTATKTARLAKGTTAVTVKLAAKARKALRRKKTVKANLKVVAADLAGNQVTKTLKVTLKR